MATCYMHVYVYVVLVYMCCSCGCNRIANVGEVDRNHVQHVIKALSPSLIVWYEARSTPPHNHLSHTDSPARKYWSREGHIHSILHDSSRSLKFCSARFRKVLQRSRNLPQRSRNLPQGSAKLRRVPQRFARLRKGSSSRGFHLQLRKAGLILLGDVKRNRP